MAAFWSNVLARFLVLYAALYAGFGVLSPYLPSLLGARDLQPEAIALVLAVGTAVRLAAGPVAGRLADRLDAPKIILAICAAAAALLAFAYPGAHGLSPLLIVTLFQSAALAPPAPPSDRLAIDTAAPERPQNILRQGVHYGWLRGAGSAAFIAGSVGSGYQAIWDPRSRVAQCRTARSSSIGCVVRAGAVAATRCEWIQRDRRAISPGRRRFVPIAALILGSHATHDSFAVIRWRAAGI